MSSQTDLHWLIYFVSFQCSLVQPYCIFYFRYFGQNTHQASGPISFWGPWWMLSYWGNGKGVCYFVAIEPYCRPNSCCLKLIILCSAKVKMNQFSCVFFVDSVWEIVGQQGGGLSVLRTFRLMRVLKLVRFMPALQRQLVVLMKTMDNVATFCMLLMLFIFIFRYGAMHISIDKSVWRSGSFHVWKNYLKESWEIEKNQIIEHETQSDTTIKSVKVSTASNLKDGCKWSCEKVKTYIADGLSHLHPFAEIQ